MATIKRALPTIAIHNPKGPDAEPPIVTINQSDYREGVHQQAFDAHGQPTTRKNAVVQPPPAPDPPVDPPDADDDADEKPPVEPPAAPGATKKATTKKAAAPKPATKGKASQAAEPMPPLNLEE